MCVQAYVYTCVCVHVWCVCAWDVHVQATVYVCAHEFVCVMKCTHL